jgi:hypothetical protein
MEATPTFPIANHRAPTPIFKKSLLYLAVCGKAEKQVNRKRNGRKKNFISNRKYYQFEFILIFNPPKLQLKNLLRIIFATKPQQIVVCDVNNLFLH